VTGPRSIPDILQDILRNVQDIRRPPASPPGEVFSDT
jgi:hypothetical protein